MIIRNLMSKQIIKQYNFVRLNLNFAGLNLIKQSQHIMICLHLTLQLGTTVQISNKNGDSNESLQAKVMKIGQPLK
jgi:hypothetical protein